VKEFQQYYGLKADGIADKKTQDKIKSVANSPFQNGKRHDDTPQLKRDLNKIGFGGITVTTLFSDFTEKRVREFQKEYGLVVNGIADEVTLAKIAEVVKNGVGSTKTEYTDYNLTLNQALDIQMDRPTIITDKYKSDPAYVSAKYLDLSKSGNQATVKSNVNVRAGTGTSYHIFGKLKKGDKVKVISKGNNWHEIEYSVWRNPKRSDMKTYLDPNKNDKFQHLRLDSSVGVSAAQLNKVLSGKGILEGQGQAFINGTKKHGVNEAYLIAHALLETGHGTSTLAKGVEVGKDKNGKLVRVTSSNRKNLTAIKTTYNMFGIGAVDSNPLNGGAITAYENGWFSPAAAIEGGAKWIGDGYIYNEHRQNTLYKMKWNPRMSEGYAWKQYATDIAWATKQVTQIKNIYNQLDNPSYHYDIARYK